MKALFLESDSLSNKRIVIFGINRIQSYPTVTHIRHITTLHDKFVSAGIDDVYCVSFCNFILFDILAPKLSKKIKFIQLSDEDNLESFKCLLDKKGNSNFLREYWQFACVLNNMVVEQYYQQPFVKIKIGPDTKEKIYSEVNPDYILSNLGV